MKVTKRLPTFPIASQVLVFFATTDSQLNCRKKALFLRIFIAFDRITGGVACHAHS
jgi:hypothetical protein